MRFTNTFKSLKKKVVFENGAGAYATDASKNLVFITGATGQVGAALTKKLSGQGNAHLCLLSRNADRLNHGLALVNNPYVEAIQTPKDMGSRQAWRDAISPVIERVRPENVTFVNTIGGGTPEGGKTLSEINKEPVVNSAEALRRAVLYFGICAGSRYIHFSTAMSEFLKPEIAEAMRNGDPKGEFAYEIVKVQTDEELMAVDMSSIVLRLGLVMGNILPGGVIDSPHPYSLEQVVVPPIVPMIRSKANTTMTMQPVAMGDVLQAVENLMTQDEYNGKSFAVDVVGPDKISARDLKRFFKKEILGEELYEVGIGPKIAKVLGDHFPYGRIAPWSMSLFVRLAEKPERVLDPTLFEKIVGRPLTHIREIYSKENLAKSGGDRIVIPKPPVMQHTKMALKILASSPKARLDLYNAVKEEGWSVVKEAASVLYNEKGARNLVRKALRNQASDACTWASSYLNGKCNDSEVKGKS